VPDWVVLATAFVAVAVAALFVRPRLMRRWVEGRMSTSRLAAVSLALTYAPAVVVVLVSAALGTRWSITGLLVLAVVLLPVLFMGFGMRRALLEYAERYGGVKRMPERKDERHGE
jgi:hypothetical protein